jgi:serine/threonine protein kinase
LSTARQVAVEILHDGTPEDINLPFQQEAPYLSRFSHLNIVGVYAYGQETWRAPRSFSLSGESWFEKFSKTAPVKTFIALEWIEGETVESIYQKRLEKPVVLNQQMRWFMQAANALSVVHGSGLIHRDIKPGNLMVTGEGRDQADGLRDNADAVGGADDPDDDRKGVRNAGVHVAGADPCSGRGGGGGAGNGHLLVVRDFLRVMHGHKAVPSRP